MSSNDSKNEITLTSIYFLDDSDQFKNLEKAITEVYVNLFYLEEAVKEIQEKVNLLVTKNEKMA